MALHLSHMQKPISRHSETNLTYTKIYYKTGNFLTYIKIDIISFSLINLTQNR